METSDRRHQELMALQAVRIASQIVVKQIQHQHADFRTPLIGVAREVKEILLVDPDPDGLGAVQAALRLIQGFCGRGAGLGPAGGIAGPRDACFLRRPCSIVIGGATDHAD